MGHEDFVYLSPGQLSELIGVSVSTLMYWRQEGTGPPYSKLGRHVRYERSDVRAWAEGSKRDRTN